MPNKKAEKITFIGNGQPPLLNLTQNEPKVYDNFKTVQENNAPFINEMLQPLWKNTIEGDSVFDKYNNRYYISNGTLYKNDQVLTTVANTKFVKEDVTDTYGQYMAFDIKSNKLAHIELTNNNTIKLYTSFETEAETSQLFAAGEIVCSRVKILTDYNVAVIVYKDENNVLKATMMFAKSGSAPYIVTKTVTYRTQVIKNSGTAANNIQTVAVQRSVPLINIAELDNSTIGVSLISNYGKNNISATTLPNYQDGVATYIITPSSSNTKEYGVDLIPSTATQSKEVTTTYNVYCNINAFYEYSYSNKQCLLDPNDNKFYEYENGAKGNEITFDTQIPVSAGLTTEIGGVTYDIYTYILYVYDLGVGERYLGPTSLDSASITLTFGNQTTTQNINTGIGSQSEVKFHWTSTDWEGNNLTVDTVSLTYTPTGEATPRTVSVPQEYWQGNTVFDQYTSTSTQNVGSLTHPNAFLDSGEMVSWYSFNSVTKQSYSTGNIITETARLNVSPLVANAYTWTAVEEVTISNASLSVNSIGRGFAQNFATSTVRLSDIAFDTASPTSGNVIEYNNSNCSDLRYYPGTTYDSAFSYRNSGPYQNGLVDMELLFTKAGYRTALSNRYNLLINITDSGSCVPYGISYSYDDNYMGTLLTEWASLDTDFYIIADGGNVYYRDSYNRIYKISIVVGNDLFAIIGDRYVIINTTSYYNCYDSFLNKLTHYATDYNGRALAGSDTVSGLTNTYLTQARYFATGINNNISNENVLSNDNDRLCSILIPETFQRIRIAVANDVKAFKCQTPINTNATTKGIDVYYSEIGGNYNTYRYSIRTDGLQTSWSKFDLRGTTYTSSSNVLYSPDIFTQYINGIGNNDFVKEGTSCYPMIFYNSQAVLLYNPRGEVDNVDAFFVLQGQYYAVINNKIYSIIYSDGMIDEMDAIVDIKGFRFLGNTPAISFFWSDKLRAVFSFTGDANMAKLWDASKFENLYLSTNGKYFYDESTQSVFIPTDQGLLVFGTENSYLMREYKNITNIQFTDEEFHVMDAGNTYNFKYYNDGSNNSESEHVKMETSFFGLGDGEVSTIDKWAITLYCPDEKWTDVIKLKTVSLTDCVTTSEEKTIKVTKDMWDKKSNSCLIIYNPKLIKGQGLKLIIDCPFIIQSIIPHIADQGTSTLTNQRKMG